MKHLTQKILFIFAIASFASCEMLVEFELPDQDPRLVLFSYYETGTDDMIIFVGTSSGITTADPYRHVSDATVEILVNNEAVALGQFLLNFPDEEFPGTELFDFRQSVYIADLSGVALNPGDLFTVVVNAAGFETLTATDIVPENSPLLNVEYRHRGATQPISNDPLDQYIFRVADQGPGRNYYMPTGIISYIFMDEDSLSTDTFDEFIVFDFRGLVAEAGFNGPVFTNAGRQGTTFDIEFTSFASLEPEFTEKITVSLHNISEDRFLFEKSMLIVSNTSGNPFAEPAFLHSNVEGGYGFLSVFHAHTLELFP